MTQIMETFFPLTSQGEMGQGGERLAQAESATDARPQGGGEGEVSFHHPAEPVTPVRGDAVPVPASRGRAL